MNNVSFFLLLGSVLKSVVQQVTIIGVCGEGIWMVALSQAQTVLQPCTSIAEKTTQTLVPRVINMVHMLRGRIQCIDVAIAGRIDGELLLCLLLASLNVILQTHEALIEFGFVLCGPHQGRSTT